MSCEPPFVVDSAALFRTDYTGRGELSERQMQMACTFAS
jgi:hypothetical protein